MKNTNIAKIRQHLKNIITITNTEPHVVSDKVIGELARKALALLPCETCNGTKIKWTGHGHKRHRILCPDCQPKLCICCEEITEENAHLHRNCGK